MTLFYIDNVLKLILLKIKKEEDVVGQYNKTQIIKGRALKDKIETIKIRIKPFKYL